MNYQYHKNNYETTLDDRMAILLFLDVDGFKNLNVFNRAIRDTYGSADDIESYDRIVQPMT